MIQLKDLLIIKMIYHFEKQQHPTRGIKIAGIVCYSGVVAHSDLVQCGGDSGIGSLPLPVLR